MKRHIFLLILLIGQITLPAQTIIIPTLQSCGFLKDTIKANELCVFNRLLMTGDATMTARDKIILKPGFRVGVNELNNNKFKMVTDFSKIYETGPYVNDENSEPSLNTTDCIPGTIGGSIDVSSSGAAIYQLPIQVSPGSNGMQPRLSIVYNSQGGNGLLGYGWNLSGLSSITRVNRNKYYNDSNTAIKFDTTDIFALDGDRLKDTTGYYFPISNPYTKVEFSNGLWKVTTQDGMVMEYGKNGNSTILVEGSNEPIGYAINRITDPNGNYIDFIYIGDNINSDHRISEIKYTGNGSNAPYNSIKFSYGFRIDKGKFYVAGKSLVKNAILSSIKVVCEGRTSKEYTFSYFYDELCSKLQSISFSSEGVKYNPTYIKWAPKAIIGSTTPDLNVSKTTLGYSPGKSYFGDFNGDGSLEAAIHYESARGVVVSSLSANISFEEDRTYSEFNSTFTHIYKFKDISIADWNNDGKDEILYHYTHSVSEYTYDYNTDTQHDWFEEYDCIAVYNYNANEFSPAEVIFQNITQDRIDKNIQIPKPSKYNYYFADYNKDGKMDVSITRDSVLNSIQGFPSPSPTLGIISNIKTIEFDGDGMPDLLITGRKDNIEIWEYNATKFTKLFTGNFKYISPGDFNGDGKTDFLCYNSEGIYISYSTGAGFVNGPNLTMLNSMKSLYVDDINGDGRSDIITYNDGYMAVYSLNNEALTQISAIMLQSYFTPYNNNYSNPVTITTTDLNNDGQKDIVFSCDQLLNFPIIAISYVNRLDQSLYVSSITDGLGNKSEFTYFTKTDSRVFNPSFTKPALPLVLARGPMQLVKNLKTFSSGIEVENIDYTYTDGYSHINLGFLGFKQFTTENITIGAKTTSKYEYTIPGVDGIYSPWLKESISTRGMKESKVTNNTIVAKKLNVKSKSFIPVITNYKTVDGNTNTETTTNVTFDEVNGRITSQIVNVGSWTITTTTQYASIGNITKPTQIDVVRINGNDTKSETTTFTYSTDKPLRVTSIKKNNRQTDFLEFNAYGGVIKQKYEDRVTSCKYDSKGRFIEESTDVDDLTTSFSYRYSDGTLLAKTDKLGLTTRYNYVNSGSSMDIQVVLPDGRIATNKRSWSTGDYAYSIEESISSGGMRTKTYYNALEQKRYVEYTGFKGASRVSSYTYEKDGSVKTETNLGITTTYSYGNDGRLSSVVGNNLKLSYLYNDDGSIATNDEIKGIVQTKYFDGLGNVTKILDSKNGDVENTYDAFGRVTNVKVDNRNTVMDYDTWGNQTKLITPDAGEVTYEYDKYNQLTSQKDKDGNIKVQLTYDPKNGRLNKRTADGIDEVYTYSANGLLTSVKRGTIEEIYEYDTYFRLKTKTLSESINTKFTTNLEYDNSGQVSRVTYPSGLKLLYGYDDYGNLNLIKDEATLTPIWTGNTKTPQEQWEKFTLGNGLVTQWKYAGDYQLNAINTGTTTLPTSIQQLGYNFNTKGQLLSRTDGNNLIESFDYDNLNRLKSATIGSNIYNVNYSNNGNIDSTTLAGKYLYDVNHPHAVSNVEGPAESSCTKSELITNSTFTSENRIATMDNGTYKNVFTYGLSGNRFKVEHFKNGDKVFTKYYDGNSEFILDNVGVTKQKRTLIYAPTGICAVYQDSVGVKEFYYIHTDYLGSWLKITNQAGNVKNSYSYDAWGRPRNPKTWALLPIGITDALANLNAMQPRFDRGYTGHEHMCGFGLINMNGRLYDPYLQRFLSPDPFVQSPENAQNYNRYTYCLNNPLMYTDPSGYFQWPWEKAKPATDASGGGGGVDVNAIFFAFSQLESGTTFHFSDGKVSFVTTTPGMSEESSMSVSNYVEKNFGSNIPILRNVAYNLAIDDLTIAGSKTSIKSEGRVPAGGGDGGFGKTAQTIAMTANVADITVDIAENTIQTTRVGANFAYAISGSSKLVNVVSNTIKYAPYVGLGVTMLTGGYLSTEINPATGRPYQSWGETGTDVGVNIATMYIGAQYGGWYGAGAAALYIGVKINVQYQMNNGLNPGMIFIMNKE